jgi:hypothetical protein
MLRFFVYLTLLSVSFLKAQESLDISYYLPQNITYNSAVPSPQSIIGHEVGEWHVTHDKLIAYMKALAAASDRVAIENRGHTFEGRPLLLLTITASENHHRLGDIQKTHLQLTDPVLGQQAAIQQMPLVVYQGFSIHGNEPSGSNAALLLAYYLAAAESPEINHLLEQTIILLDPSFNPDGLQRFAHWANSHKSNRINPDPNDREFHEAWPGARTNHYWFDLNRDWLPVQLPESRARIKTFHQWQPNILTDHHEMGSHATFFFQPGIPSRVHPLTPAYNQQLTKEIATYHAAALDSIGSLYYTEEDYDDFYYGKGSTYPDINGGVGILFEQGSSRGHAQETDNGILTFPFGIRNQLTAALSTLKAGFEMRVKLLDFKRNFFKNARRDSNRKKARALVFGDAHDQAKTNHLADILLRHQLAVYRPKDDLRIAGEKFSKNSSFIVPLQQQNSTLLEAMFERRTAFQDSLFYDVSAWSFPLAFNMPYASLSLKEQLAERVEEVPWQVGGVNNKSKYAYLFEWGEYYTPRALDKLLQKGIRAKVAMQPFELAGKKYDYGTVLIPVQNQLLSSDELYDFLQEVARQSQLTITGVNTGLTQGIDLGSKRFELIRKPKVALVVGKGINAYDAGQVWHLFDQRYDMNITKLDPTYLQGVDLSKYTTIILPDMRSALSKSLALRLRTWVQRGGTLIGYKNALRWLSKHDLIKLSYKTPTQPVADISFEQIKQHRGAQRISGAIFETRLDRSHPINFGYSKQSLPMFRSTTIFIHPDSISQHNPIRYTSSPLMAGYVSTPNLEALQQTVPFQVKALGDGRVVVFTDNTNFRAFWYGTNKLLMNAVFFAKSM